MTLALPTPETGRAAAGLCATARIVARADGQGTTRLPVLDGDGPFALRRIRGYGNQARVCVVGAMSAPLGGDRLGIEATAEAGSALHLTAAAATVALPGRTGEHARYDVWLTVGDGARLDWLPEPLISAAGSDLRMTTTVELAPTARLVLREEQVLGRSGEPTGALRSRLTVRRAAGPCSTRRRRTGPASPAGTPRPSWTGTALSVNSWSSDRSSRSGRSRCGCSAAWRASGPATAWGRAYWHRLRARGTGHGRGPGRAAAAAPAGRGRRERGRRVTAAAPPHTSRSDSRRARRRRASARLARLRSSTR